MSLRALLHHPKVPEQVRNAFSQAIVTNSPEQVLWREVCARHTLDAFGIVGLDEVEEVAKARDWFDGCYDDVLLAFEYAGVSYEPVVKSLDQFLKGKQS